METLFIGAALISGGYMLFRHAKRVGSRKGFAAGRRRERKRNRRIGWRRQR